MRKPRQFRWEGRKKRKCMLQLLSGMLLLLTYIVPVSASADPYEIALQCATADGTVTMDGEKLQVYQVADEKEEVVAAFEAVKVSAEEAVYAEALAEHAKTSGVKPICSLQVKENGYESMTLEGGVYLVTGDPIRKGKITYTPVPYLIRLTGNAYHQLTSYVKYTSDEPAPQDPDRPTESESAGAGTAGTGQTANVKTGDPTNVSLWMGLLVGSGVLFVALLLFVCIVRKRGKRNEK